MSTQERLMLFPETLHDRIQCVCNLEPNMCCKTCGQTLTSDNGSTVFSFVGADQPECLPCFAEGCLATIFKLCESQSNNMRPCVLCGKGLPPVGGDWKTMQPWGGGEVRMKFAYGSLHDMRKENAEVVGVICDECANKMIRRMEEC